MYLFFLPTVVSEEDGMRRLECVLLTFSSCPSGPSLPPSSPRTHTNSERDLADSASVRSVSTQQSHRSSAGLVSDPSPVLPGICSNAQNMSGCTVHVLCVLRQCDVARCILRGSKSHAVRAALHIRAQSPRGVDCGLKRGFGVLTWGRVIGWLTEEASRWSG